MDDIIRHLTPKSARIAAMLKECQSPEALVAAHPEITAGDLDALCAEIMQLGKATGGGKPKRAKKRAPAAEALQIKITLNGSKPPIWRRVVVPGDIRLDYLHEVIQIAMGWDNAHLHQFEIDGEIYSGRTPDGEMLDEMEGCDEAEFRLCDLAGVKSKFCYEYDFGDGWQHDILIEKSIPAAEAPKTIVCLTGKGRCPPEDCGGLWGYYDKLDALADPKHPEHDEIVEWMGEIDPTEFNCDEVTAALAELKW